MLSYKTLQLHFSRNIIKKMYDTMSLKRLHFILYLYIFQKPQKNIIKEKVFLLKYAGKPKTFHVTFTFKILDTLLWMGFDRQS